MANATSVTVRAGNDQFRGLYTNTFLVRATLDADSLVDGAGDTDTVTVPGVALGDMVLSASLAVDVAGLIVTAYVSAANTVSIRFQNETGGTVDLASSVKQSADYTASVRVCLHDGVFYIADGIKVRRHLSNRLPVFRSRSWVLGIIEN